MGYLFLSFRLYFFQNQDFHYIACFRRILKEQAGVSGIASDLCLGNVPFKPRASAEVKKMWIYTSTPPYAFMR
jgi:hypothetical protein